MAVSTINQQIGYLNALRVVAVLLVILAHTSLAYYGKNDVIGADNFFARLYHYVSEVSVPIFVMISGSLFLRPDKEDGRWLTGWHSPWAGCYDCCPHSGNTYSDSVKTKNAKESQKFFPIIADLRVFSYLCSNYYYCQGADPDNKT